MAAHQGGVEETGPEQRYQRLLAAVTDYVFHVRVEDGRAVETVHASNCEAVTGYTPREFADNPMLWIAMVPPEDRAVVEQQAARILSGQDAAPIEHRIRRKDGRMRWVQNTVSPQRDGHGRLIAYDGLLRDITERMEAEKKLRESEEFGRQVVSSLQEGLIVFDRDLRYRSWNRFMEQLSGLADEQVLGRHPDELFPWMREQEMLAGVERALAGESLVHPDVLVRDAGTGNEIWVAGRSVPLRDSQGQIIGAITTLQDITKRKRAEEALHHLNETLEKRVAEQMREIRLLAEAVSNLGEGVLITSIESEWPGPRIVFVNEAMCRISGYTLDEMVGQTPRILHGDGTQRETLDRIRAELSAGRSCPAELVYYRKDGTPYDAELFITPLVDAQGRRTNFVSIHRDISERKRAEQALREREERLRAILDTAADAIITLDRRGMITAVNPATERMFGYTQDELLGQDIEILVPPYCDEDDGCFARYLPTGKARIIDVGRRKEGSTFPIDLVVSKINQDAFAGIIRDVSERRKLQQHLLEIAGEEQRRIGQELHDGIGQELTGLSLFAGTLSETLEVLARKEADGKATWVLEEADFLRLRQTASRLSRGLVEANRHVHDLSHGIMPVQIDAEGLRSALQELAATTDAQQNVTCCFECNEAGRSRRQ